MYRRVRSEVEGADDALHESTYILQQVYQRFVQEGIQQVSPGYAIVWDKGRKEK